MFESIFLRTISKINAIMKYNDIQMEHMPKAIEKGINRNAIIYVINIYIKTVIKGERPEGIPDDIIERTKRFIEEATDILEVKKAPNEEVQFTFKYKDSQLLKELGYELNLNKAVLETSLYSEMRLMQNNIILLQTVICFEDFIAGMFRFLVTSYPDFYLKDRSITFSEIVKMDHATIRSYLIENEVTNIMWEGFPDWIKRIEKHKVDLSCLQSYISEYIEIACRRNLIVHNDGVVNQIYLNCVNECKFRNGEQIYIDQDYLKRAFLIVQILVYGIIINSIKMDTDNAKGILSIITTHAFESLKAEEWELCMFIYQILKANKYLSEEDRTYATINYWITKKNLFGLTLIKQEIEETDFSAMQDKFKMGKEMLLENYEAAGEYLDALFPEAISAEKIETWPIFIQYRETDKYISFREKHRDKFSIKTISESPLIDDNGKDIIKSLNTQETILYDKHVQID